MLLCISDFHNIQPFKKLDKVIDDTIEAVFFTGDLSNWQETANYFIEYFKKKKLELYCIAGNNDPSSVRTIMTCDVEKHEKKFKHWRVAGIGGGLPSPYYSTYEKTDAQIKTQLEKIKIDENTILLSHVPPYGVLDMVSGKLHIGSHSLHQAIIEHKPFAVFCGHVHEQEGYEKLGSTHIFKIPAVTNSKVMKVDLQTLKFEIIKL